MKTLSIITVLLGLINPLLWELLQLLLFGEINNNQVTDSLFASVAILATLSGIIAGLYIRFSRHTFLPLSLVLILFFFIAEGLYFQFAEFGQHTDVQTIALAMISSIVFGTFFAAGFFWRLVKSQ